jgi:hypothetical protein
MRPRIDLADARKPADAIAARALKRLAGKLRAANQLGPIHPAAKAPVAIPLVAIHLGAMVVDPTAVHGRHVAAPMNRSHVPSRVRKLVGPKVSGAMTILSSSMTTTPTALAAAC